ncbi:hypothetical protein BH09PLA1_BH09PLA1_35040 [soil metagenome]
MLGITLDPTFGQVGGNDFVYVYYTAAAPAPHNRISRFLAAGDVASGGEQILVDLPNIGSTTAHFGGALNFGLDGKLYVAIGDQLSPNNAQSLEIVAGKILRFNPDGTIPTDNPFVSQTTGIFNSIWARGLRNPFTSAVQPSTGKLFINDVGESTWEEINLGAPGSNYGWPITEGAFDPVAFPTLTNPFLTYNHTDGKAIIGGAFYEPTIETFPQQYRGKYFYGDFISGWIRYLDPVTKAVGNFATGASFMTSIKLAADGALWYLSRDTAQGGAGLGKIYRIQYSSAQAPQIALQPQDQTVTPGDSATFTVSALGSAPLAFQWQRNNVNITGATGNTYTIASATLADDAATFRCVVSNSFGNATSNAVTLTVTQNTRPVPVIISPTIGTTYRGGQEIFFAGAATDVQDPKIPPSAFTWSVDLHHDQHSHPFMPPTSGSTDGSFTIASVGETSPNVFYRIMLTVTDSGGLKQSVTRDIAPRTANLTLNANLPGLSVSLDGQPRALPTTIAGVEGISRSLDAPATQVVGGKTYQFVGWSDGGAPLHAISFPSTDASYTAFYRVEPNSLAYLSDLSWVGTPQNGWGPVERDMSNGGNGAFDGRPLMLNGVVYGKGLGAHAQSSITYNLAGAYSRFTSDVGVDDEAAGAASIVFQVFVDDVKVFDSGTMIGSTATKHVDVSVAGANQLRLVINDGGNGNTDDHGDWAGARLTAVSSAVPLILNGTANDDTWTLRLTPAGTALDVWFNAPTSGAPTQTVPLASIESIAVKGLAGDDLLILDSSNGAFAGVNRIAFDGGTNATAAGDTLRYVGVNTAEIFDVAANGFSIGVLPVSHTAVENLRIETLNGNDAINLHQQSAAAIQFDGGLGANTLTFRGGTHSFASDLGMLALHFDIAVRDVAILNFTGSQHLAALTLDGVAQVNLASGGDKVLRVASINLFGSAQLDLNDNAIIVDYSAASSLTSIQSLINSGRNGGAWNAWGITSTSAKSASPANTTLAAMESSDFKSIYGPKELFAGESVDTTAVLVRYTYYGDADFNGVVNFDDYSRIDVGFLSERTGWTNGDFDGNGIVNFDDYSLIDLAFNTQAAAINTPTARQDRRNR